MSKNIFLLGLFLVFIGVIFSCVNLGPYRFALKNKQTKERLRDFTFPVWDSKSVKEHGFLVFLENEKSYENRYAYGSHGYGFLFFEYLLYRIEKFTFFIPMRISIVIISLCISLYMITNIIFENLNDFNYKSFFVLSSFLAGFTSSIDLWWTSLFNVDNSFIIFTPVFGSILFFLLKDKKVAYVFCYIMPLISSVTAFLSSLVLFFRNPFCKNKISNLFIFSLCLSSLLFYGVPLLVIDKLGFKSAASSFLFRSGFDGDRTYFTNHLQAVFWPIFERPYSLATIFIVAYPLMCLGIEIYINKTKNLKKFQIPFIILGLYCLNVLFFPQAISIHPYLFDYIFIFSFWILLLFVQIKVINYNQKFALVFCASNTALLIINIICLFNIFSQSIAKNFIPFGST